jgi:oligoribonuclease NrnB/cAMP/cGMP phosphodiesterase (DHH superfamily)
MKTVCIYHSADLDGWCSAAIVKHWYIKNNKDCIIFNKSNSNIMTNEDKIVFDDRVQGKENESELYFIGYNYGNEIPDLSEYNRVIMCDISFPANIMKQLHRKLTAQKGYVGNGKEKTLDNFIWLDHHISAIKDMEKEYPVGNSVPISLPSGLRDTKFAACELTWRYYFPKKEMPELVRLLGRYDCFGHRGSSEEQTVFEFQYGARSVISNYNECFDVLTDNIYYGNETIENILSDGQSIYRFLCTDAIASYKNGFKVILSEEVAGCTEDPNKQFEDREFICINKEKFNPINFGINYHKDGYDGCMCFYFDGKEYNCSIYNDNGKVDCSVIAKGFAGGGHQGAAGFRLNRQQFEELIKNK